jgi:hypothetical protein
MMLITNLRPRKFGDLRLCTRTCLCLCARAKEYVFVAFVYLRKKVYSDNLIAYLMYTVISSEHVLVVLSDVTHRITTCGIAQQCLIDGLCRNV